MTSWFSVSALTELAAKVTDSDAVKELSNHVQSVTNDISSKVSEVSSEVRKNIPDIQINNETLQKLSLMSPDMVEERERIYEEEENKKFMRDSLAGILPWETNDEERDILVEECKEAILSLGLTPETFLGPFQMPQMPNAKKNVATHQREEIKEEEDSEAEEEGINDEQDQQEIEGEEGSNTNLETNDNPSDESLEKLKKLEPLPILLANFDLDSHVGLIQRLLKEDPNLVRMQASLSGGGKREEIFWKNYFFHCAFTRYEAGMSLDEIWNQEAQQKALEKLRNKEQNENEGGNAEVAHSDLECKDETTIVFNSDDEDYENNEESSTSSEIATASESQSKTAAKLSVATNDAMHEDDGTMNANKGNNSEIKDSTTNRELSDGSEFEMVDDDIVRDVVTEVGTENDDLLDELEAEIARELED